jgi:1-phosphofructokinase
MIYTVTLNPSIDYIMRLDQLSVGETNRITSTQYVAGGKGMNVSRMLKNLGADSYALGFLAGNTGRMYRKLAETYGVCTDFIELAEGETRINVKIKAAEETELNAKGPLVSPTDEELLMNRLKALQPQDILVLAGSVPPGIQDGIYARILKKVSENGIRVVVDTTGKNLRAALLYHPFLVKPNIAELGEFFGVSVTGRKEALEYGKKLTELGAEHVIVSMGADGAVFADRAGHELSLAAVQGKVVDSVGAGDSMVAGFLKGILEGKGVEHAFRLAVACGCASTFSCEFGTKNDVKNIYSLLTLQ